MLDASLSFTFGLCKKLQVVTVTIGLVPIPSTDEDDEIRHLEQWQNASMWEPLMRALSEAPHTLSQIRIRFMHRLYSPSDCSSSILPSLYELNWDLLESIVCKQRRNLTSIAIVLPPSLSTLVAVDSELHTWLGRHSAGLVNVLIDPSLSVW